MRTREMVRLERDAYRIVESCPLYQDDGFACEGYGEGDLCNTSCQYLSAFFDELEMANREFHKLLHG